MATYNGASFIRQQIESILPQLEANDEFVFADDGSTDDTLSIIQSYQDNRFKLINTGRTGSPAKAFEVGLKHCTGNMIFLADQDDVWKPEKVIKITSLLKSFDLILTDCSIINEHNEKITDSFFLTQRSRKGLLQNILYNSYMGCCMAFHRKILDRALPFPVSLKAHDQWIGLIAERYFNVHFLDEPLVEYRRHGKNYSFTGEKSHFNLFEKINHRLTMVTNVYKR
jgi:glycosyltransferase involved in cell wall biosynthesis